MKFTDNKNVTNSFGEQENRINKLDKLCKINNLEGRDRTKA